ncbi:hypothetical protein V6N13_114080 [Hibiscus sabdariffa]|uniref:Uncharacterized protein n=1 Tax=Hibiscus sabdariffa TaxID=183260 RepID=A0ABR2U1A8_9ROSI
MVRGWGQLGLVGECEREGAGEDGSCCGLVVWKAVSGGGEDDGNHGFQVLVSAVAVDVVAGRSVGAADKVPGCPALFGL